MRTIFGAFVTAETGDTGVFYPRPRRRVRGPSGRWCGYVRKTQLEMAAAASAGHTRPPRDRNLNRLMVLGLPNLVSMEEGSTGMTVPATAASANCGTRNIPASDPSNGDARDLGKLLVEAAKNPQITDRTYRFLSIVIYTFGAERFSTSQVADATGTTLHGAGIHLRALADIGLVTNRRVVVGYNEDGSKVRTRIYRLAGVAA